MKDIARELGVSVVTVSKALRNHDDISEETRGKVLQLMRDMNYRPNLAARALVTGRSYIVGFVVPGETVMLLGGAVAGQGAISIYLLIAVAWFSAWLGDTTSFFLGRRLGRDFVLKHGPRFGISHERFVSDEIGRLLEKLRAEEEALPYDSDDASLIRVTRRDWEKARIFLYRTLKVDSMR